MDPIPEKSNVAGPQKSTQVAKPVVLKPQITKEYVNSQVIGRPDFSILHDNYEKGDKFYEP